MRRTKCRISPFGFAGDFCSDRNFASTIADAWFDASSDDPGGSVTLTWTLPSSNGGRKSAPSVRQPPGADADQHPGQQQQHAGAAMLKRIEVRRPAHFSPRSRKPSPVAVGRLRVRQQVVRQHRRDGQRHEQRRQDRHDVGDAQRREQPAFDADRANSGRKTRIDDGVPKTMRVRISALAS